MDVRLRLIAGFVIIALFVLVLFGVVAHRAALSVNRAQTESVTYEIVKTHAAALDKADAGLPLINVVRSQGPLKNSEEMLFVLTDTDGQPLATSSTNQLLNSLVEQFSFHEAISHQNNSGSEKSFTWTKAEVPNHAMWLFLIHKQDPALPSFSSELGERLLVTAFVIIWLAVWVALIVSKRFVRKLDQQNAAILYQSLFDHLTDLPNRRQLNEKLQSCIDDELRIALILLDLNNLSDVNKTLGHQSGDQLVKLSAQKIQQYFDDSGMVARLGGDEFAVIVEAGSAEQIEQLARSLIHHLNEPIKLGNLEVVTHASIGYAMYPDQANNADSLMQHAEVAMHHAQQERISVQRYAAELDPNSVKRLALMSQLRQAIDNGQLVAYYQPKIDLKTNTTISVETLVRWIHPQQGMIPPNEFIYLAEKSDLIDKLTLWVVEKSIRQCREWLEMDRVLQVAVNLSTRNLHNAGLPKQIEQLLDKWQVPPQLLKLEITEGSIMSNPETSLNTLMILHNMGIQLSVDDFGTGYSSLSYLKRLPISELKIDRSFVMDMQANENDEIIVRSTIDLAHNMGLTVVAEGIEDDATMQQLLRLGCDVGQGYYMCRPIPDHELSEWLTASPWPARIISEEELISDQLQFAKV